MGNKEELKYREDLENRVDPFDPQIDADILLPEDIKIPCVEDIMEQGPEKDSWLVCCWGIIWYLKRKETSEGNIKKFLRKWYDNYHEKFDLSKIDFEGVIEMLLEHRRERKVYFLCTRYPEIFKHCNNKLCVFCRVGRFPKFEGFWYLMGEFKFSAYCLYNRFIQLKNKFSKASSFAYKERKAFFVTIHMLMHDGKKQLFAKGTVEKGIKILEKFGLIEKVQKIDPDILKHYRQKDKLKTPTWYILHPYYKIFLKYYED